MGRLCFCFTYDVSKTLLHLGRPAFEVEVRHFRTLQLLLYDFTYEIFEGIAEFILQVVPVCFRTGDSNRGAAECIQPGTVPIVTVIVRSIIRIQFLLLLVFVLQVRHAPLYDLFRQQVDLSSQSACHQKDLGLQKVGSQIVSFDAHSLEIFASTFRTFGKMLYEVSRPVPLREILIEKLASPSSVHV